MRFHDPVVMNIRYLSAALVLFPLGAFVSCQPAVRPPFEDSAPRADAQLKSTAAPLPTLPAVDAAVDDAMPDSPPQPDAGVGSGSLLDMDDDPMALHKETKQELLALFSLREFTDKERASLHPDAFLDRVFGIGSPQKASQGNKEIAVHTISKRKCMEGLKDVVLQTPEQRKICGADYMVPINAPGKPATYCIDQFEFPNKPCELPVVWMPPTFAKQVCEMQGKRLCSQPEWQESCRADPAGGPDQRYAYGDKLDIEVCHTNRGHRQTCDASWSDKAWKSCTTDTEPAGAFPKCKSRFGVYDQHGNVAEIMYRREGDASFSQLKGSAWFYKEVQREVGEKAPKGTFGEGYPDNCNFDPRWHVEKSENAWHVNYHLGFRCCKGVQ